LRFVDAADRVENRQFHAGVAAGACQRTQVLRKTRARVLERIESVFLATISVGPLVRRAEMLRTKVHVR
jgi:hypothetical protein